MRRRKGTRAHAALPETAKELAAAIPRMNCRRSSCRSENKLNSFSRLYQRLLEENLVLGPPGALKALRPTERQQALEYCSHFPPNVAAEYPSANNETLYLP
jgi:hypothetical protein